MQEQLEFVDDFETAVKAEAEEAYIELYNEFETVQKDYIDLQKQYLAHLLEHTEYITNIHKDIAILSENLRKVSMSATTYLVVSLISIGYILFNFGG